MRRKGEPQPLSEREVREFLTVSRDKVQHHSPRDAAKNLRLRNPWRWRRMQKDIRWARRQLEKMGYDPEEIRWLL